MRGQNTSKIIKIIDSDGPHNQSMMESPAMLDYPLLSLIEGKSCEIRGVCLK